MYKLLLSWRYLRTRYLALASIISVMLGVATLIVVNAVMGGFSTKLRDRMRGIQADIVVNTHSLDGVEYHMRAQPAAQAPPFQRLPPVRNLTNDRLAEVKRILGDRIEAVTPVIESVAMLQFRVQHYSASGEFLGFSDPVTRPVTLIGIEPVGKSKTGEFAQHLVSPANREDPSRCFQMDAAARERYDRNLANLPVLPQFMDAYDGCQHAAAAAVLGAAERLATMDGPPPLDKPRIPEKVLRIYGAVVGYGIASHRKADAKAGSGNQDVFHLRPGDVITLSTLTRQLTAVDGTIHSPRPKSAEFVITDYYKSEMAEFDSHIIFVDIEDLQELRAMQNHVTSFQFKLKDYDADRDQALAALKQHFEPEVFAVSSWEQRQGPLLSAIAIERNLLNILLFLIIAVAGFGILAIFFMIVVEKTKDIGIMKSLGASNLGVMGIFLYYGLALGVVGAGLGTVLGVTFTFYINEIEQVIARMTKTDVFPRDVYYFDKIPVDLAWLDVAIVDLGAILIAVMASIGPAIRAAWMNPVRALRWE